jgi:hypothetical protein
MQFHRPAMLKLVTVVGSRRVTFLRYSAMGVIGSRCGVFLFFAGEEGQTLAEL